ncbi:hypothetical protein FJ250_01240 [bacterium]|nr:hypothetical protein [bacterium]
MSEKFRLTAVLLLLAALPLVAHASDQERPLGVGAVKALTLDLMYQDTHATTPWAYPPPAVFQGLSGGAMLGLGVTYHQPLDTNWRGKIGGGIPIISGSEVEAVGGGFTGKFSGWNVRAGLDYVHPLNEKLSIYGGGSLFYSSSKLTLEDNDGSFEGEPLNMFGFEPAIGCEHRFGGRTGFYGEFYSQFGRASTEVGTTKYGQWIKYGCWRGGLLVLF